MSTYTRSDWTVQDATGRAVPNASVYWCTQPATTTAVPPSPLATLYNDSNGDVIIANPQITNGFGQVAAYMAAGNYTVVEVWNGVIQQIYPDQPISGGATTGTGATVLQNSPALTGIPTAPTNPATGTNTTQIATCAFVQSVAVAGGSVAFSSLLAGTNPNALVVGTGGSLAVSGTGTIIATSVTGLTVTSGKTLTVDNNLELAGADSTKMTFPGTSDTVVGLAATQTLTNKTLTSPTLTTPVLGTPTSGNLVNCTFPTFNQNTTGSSGSTNGLISATTIVSVSAATAPTTGQILTATSSTTATWQNNVGSGVPATDVQIFLTDGTWTKPAGTPKWTEIVLISGGGGGGAGSTGSHGGGGGGGSTVLHQSLSTSLLGATETVTVGTGGVGGATSNAAGGDGDDSSFGNWILLPGGKGGAVTTGLGGVGVVGYIGSGGNGGTGAQFGGPSATAGADGTIYSAGGGGGGGYDGTYIPAAGGNGGLLHGSILTGGLAGTVGTPGGGAGTNVTVNEPFGGPGGGGGWQTAGGTGGTPTAYGGGGGGGSAHAGASFSAGGAGAPGIVIVTTYF